MAALKSGELSQDAIQASVERVEALKSKYIANVATPTFSLADVEARYSRQSALASKIYAKSTTVVRSTVGTFPISSNPGKKIVLVSPEKAPKGGGAVDGDNGEGKTRESCTPPTYLDVLRTHDQNVTEVQFHDGIPLSTDTEKLIKEADTVIFASRNASSHPHQRNFGIELGKQLGDRLIVVATCDPYDFLNDGERIKNYVTIYEPTIPAFSSAVDIIFGKAKPLGTLPVSIPPLKHDIRVSTKSDEDVRHIWTIWQQVFPRWPVKLERLAQNLRQDHGRHFIHQKGFVMSYFFTLGNSNFGKITAVGVLPEYRGKGLGTALIARARGALTQGPALKNLQIGSVFPRFWPAVPIEFPLETKNFLLHRGSHGFLLLQTPSLIVF